MDYIKEITSILEGNKVYVYVLEEHTHIESWYSVVVSKSKGKPEAEEGKRFKDGDAFAIWGDEILAPITPNGNYCAMYTAKMISSLLTLAQYEVMLNNEPFKPG